MDNVFHDWVKDLIDSNNRFDSLFLGRDKLNVRLISRLFSQQLIRLPINEEKLKK